MLVVCYLKWWWANQIGAVCQSENNEQNNPLCVKLLFAIAPHTTQMGKKDTFDKHKHSFPSRVVASFYMIEPIKTRKETFENWFWPWAFVSLFLHTNRFVAYIWELWELLFLFGRRVVHKGKVEAAHLLVVAIVWYTEYPYDGSRFWSCCILATLSRIEYMLNWHKPTMDACLVCIQFQIENKNLVVWSVAI